MPRRSSTKSPAGSAPAPATQRTEERRQRMLAAALDVFSELGYERASMDVVASRAQVSKPTLYAHFEDKAALFSACLAEATRETEAALEALLERRPDDLGRALREIAGEVLAYIATPRAIALWRMVAGEAGRFPELGRTFHEGAHRFRGRLGAYLAAAASRGELRVEDPELAAEHFLALCCSSSHQRVEFGFPPPSRAEVRRAVEAGVAAFLGGYGPGPEARPPAARRRAEDG